LTASENHGKKKRAQMDKKEKPFSIYDWEDLREELAAMKPRSKLYEIVKAEMVKRGHWRKRRPSDKL
jgi:hypothetical protein